MTIEDQIKRLSEALDSTHDNRARGFMRHQLRNLEYRLNQMKGRDGE